jgi:hypothetical protein
MKFNTYLEYYINMINEIQVDEKDRLNTIYNITTEKCNNIPSEFIYKFIMAWLKDSIDEKPYTIGPEFTMAIAYYNGTENDPQDDLYGSWFEEAAVRDYILKSNHFPNEVQNLKNITLEINTC